MKAQRAGQDPHGLEGGVGIQAEEKNRTQSK